jgi:hypothetical protein
VPTCLALCRHPFIATDCISLPPVCPAQGLFKKREPLNFRKKTDKSEASNNTPNDTRGDRKAGQGDCRPDDKVFRADWGHLAFSPAAANLRVWAGEVPPDTRGKPTAKKPWPPKFLQH